MADEEDEPNGDIGLINLGGRPRHYDNPSDFDARVDEFYQHCITTGEPITWTGLALFMGFACRAAIDEYAKYDGFSYSVKRAKSLVEYGYEKLLHKGSNAAAPIFALKNFGWQDKPEEPQDQNPDNLSISFTVNQPVSEVTVTRGKPSP